MFGFGKKKEGEIIATQNGKIVELDTVPDEMFAQKMLGDGVAVLPSSNEVLSPVAGVVSSMTDTLHAYGITSNDGLEVLVHVGLDTVELKGEGFKSFVKEGDKVKVGDKLAEVDLEFLKSKGYEVYTPIIITNFDELKELNFKSGDVIGGETVVMTYKK